ncbi:MAG: hypothetical protein AAF363_04335 [Bacteroidota bacterium]
MQVLIHVEVREEYPTNFKNPIIEWTKKQLPKVVTFDFDNLSENSVAGYATDLLKQAKQAFVIIDVNIEKNLGLVTKFIDTISRQQDKSIMLIVNGESPKLSKMGKTLGSTKFIQNLHAKEQKDLLKEFFHASGNDE